MMEIAPEAVEAASPSPGRRRRWTTDNPLVRAVARIRLPLGAKLLVGFAVVGALLIVGYSLGLVALSQSNSRGTQLLDLQREAASEQVLATDARQLATAVSERELGANTAAEALSLSRSTRLRLDESVDGSFEQLLISDLGGGAGGPVLNPSLRRTTRKLKAELNRSHSAFTQIELLDTEGRRSSTAQLEQVAASVSRVQAQLNELVTGTTAQAQALVAKNGRSYRSSRNLLIGIGAGSLALALLLGLILSWSLVVSVRRTQARLAQIAAGDFSGHVEVPNRDEIGALAADVNRMNDELQRLYGELEAASRHKSDFLATMSHELRTPLNAIIGFSEVLQEQMFGELNERQLAYVNDVLEAGKHLLSLINDVLDLAKIEAGHMELSLSEVAIPDVLRSAVSMHAERAGRRGVDLALETGLEEITVTADERRVRQVVFNLVSNAVKFTPAEGKVDISARADDGNVEVAVADTGPGIAAEDLEKIFEEFEQTSDGKQVEGTGLGLPLSRRLVELHGGRLWAESEPGHGSTFRFTLPVQQEVP
jgi:signal transduction histidine kinase